MHMFRKVEDPSPSDTVTVNFHISLSRQNVKGPSWSPGNDAFLEMLIFTVTFLVGCTVSVCQVEEWSDGVEGLWRHVSSFFNNTDKWGSCCLPHYTFRIGGAGWTEWWGGWAGGRGSEREEKKGKRTVECSLGIHAHTHTHALSQPRMSR